MCIVTWWINNHKTTVQCYLEFTHLNSPSTKLLDCLQNVLKKFRYLGIFYFEKYSSFLFHATFSSLNGWTCGRQQVTTNLISCAENRVGRNAKDWWKKSRFLTASHYDSFKPYNFCFSECYSRPFTRSSLRRRWWDAASCWPSSPTCGTPGTGSTSLW